MGSSLSIINNTEHEWQCHLGADQKALKVAGIVVSVLGSIAAIVGTAGAAAPLVASVAAGGALAVAGIATTAVSGLATFGHSMAQGMSDTFDSKGYERIAPGARHKWGKMSLSLWQQGTCVRSYPVNEFTVRTETLYMRPIFSGSTVGSIREYDIKSFIEKHGVSSQDTVAITQPIPSNKTQSPSRTTTEAHHWFEYHPGVTNMSDWSFDEGDEIHIYPAV